MSLTTYLLDDYCLLYELLKVEISRRIRIEMGNVTRGELDGNQPTSIGGLDVLPLYGKPKVEEDDQRLHVRRLMMSNLD